MSAKWKLGLLFVTATGLLFSFQNCGQSGPDSLSGDKNQGSVYVDPKFASLKFPYKLVGNQFGFMSCGDGNSFSFKIGAYSDTDTVYPFSTAGISLTPGGVALRTEFLTGFDAATPGMAAADKQSNLKSALMSITPSYGLQPFFSVRSPPQNGNVADPQALLMLVGANKEANYNFPMGVLSNVEFADLISQNRSKIQNYFPTAAYENRAFESEIAFKYGGSYSTEQEFTSNIGQGGLLLGFANPTTSNMTIDFPLVEIARPNTTSFRNAYGQYLLPNFANQPFRNLNTDTANQPLLTLRTLSGLDEQSLEGAQPLLVSDAGWQCRQFMIVKSGDRVRPIYKYKNGSNSSCNIVVTAAGAITSNTCVKSAACPLESYSQLYGNASNLAWMQAMRRFLPVEDWEINVSDECIVPKKSAVACYGAGNVAYDQVFVPPQAVTGTGGVAGCGGSFAPCAHYFSLCIRRGPTPR